MNWKGLGRNWSWPNLRSYHGIRLERLRKTTKTSVRLHFLRTRFKRGTYEIRTRSVNHSTATFGMKPEGSLQRS
jgi:hypothetical protein